MKRIKLLLRKLLLYLLKKLNMPEQYDEVFAKYNTILKQFFNYNVECSIMDFYDNVLTSKIIFNIHCGSFIVSIKVIEDSKRIQFERITGVAANTTLAQILKGINNINCTFSDYKKAILKEIEPMWKLTRTEIFS